MFFCPLGIRVLAIRMRTVKRHLNVLGLKGIIMLFCPLGVHVLAIRMRTVLGLKGILKVHAMHWSTKICRWISLNQWETTSIEK